MGEYCGATPEEDPAMALVTPLPATTTITMAAANKQPHFTTTAASTATPPSRSSTTSTATSHSTRDSFRRSDLLPLAPRPHPHRNLARFSEEEMGEYCGAAPEEDPAVALVTPLPATITITTTAANKQPHFTTTAASTAAPPSRSSTTSTATSRST
uniref:Uncharacterized protein n=1 Tax=Oryza rufipogon TaxID=4529 RepID=A0A0E0PV54_ORYRU